MSLDLIGPTFSSIFATVRLVQFVIELKNVPQSAQTFVRLVEQVEEDVEHALQCRIDGGKIFENYPDFYQKWTSNAINGTLRALDDLGQFILTDTKSSLDSRLRYLLDHHESLVDQERALRYSHATLLSAINAMHLMIFQGEPSQVPRPSLSPTPSGRPLRASSKRPTSRRAPASRDQHSIMASPSSDIDSDSSKTPLPKADTSQSIETMNVHFAVIEAETNLQRLQSFKVDGKEQGLSKKWTQ